MTTVLSPQKDATTYSYASQPKAIPNRKKYREKYRKEDEELKNVKFGNLMYDRRVIRGNTYSIHSLPANALPDPVELQRQVEMKRRLRAKKQAQETLQPRTPDAMEGRHHIDVQTELYLEELTDQIEEAEVEVQTDAFLDRPPSPLFVPAKTGIDNETQIEIGELFDFDLEVPPILEVLVGKTVEQSLLEVMEEEELENLRSQQRIFMELRNAELVEQQRLEEDDRRHSEEKQKRIAQEKQYLQLKKDTANRIAATAFSHSYLAFLVPNVFGSLLQNGFFYNPIENDIETSFIPYIMEDIENDLQIDVLTRQLLDGMLCEIVEERHTAFRHWEKQQSDMKLKLEASKMMSKVVDNQNEEFFSDGAEFEKENNKETDEPREKLENEPTETETDAEEEDEEADDVDEENSKAENA